MKFFYWDKEAYHFDLFYTKSICFYVSCDWVQLRHFFGYNWVNFLLLKIMDIEWEAYVGQLNIDFFKILGFGLHYTQSFQTDRAMKTFGDLEESKAEYLAEQKKRVYTDHVAGPPFLEWIVTRYTVRPQDLFKDVFNEAQKEFSAQHGYELGRIGEHLDGSLTEGVIYGINQTNIAKLDIDLRKRLEEKGVRHGLNNGP